MTRITKMGGRKAPHKATDFFADSAAVDAGDVKQQQQQERTEPQSGTEAHESTTPASESTPQQPTSKSMQSRLKLLRLKIKKTTSTEKQNSLRVEMRQLEKRIREENGRQGGGGANGGDTHGGMKRKRTEDDQAEWRNETNPWKRMEAERRSKTLQASTDRREKRAAQRASSQRCFACRAMGHSARECPENLNSNSTSLGSDTKNNAVKGAQAVGICFRCGSTEHTLKMCKKSKKINSDGSEKLPHATCFVCSHTGHLSSQCPQNAQRGIYPEGGSCKVCQSIHHLVKDCPENKAPRMKAEDEYAPAAKVASVAAQPTAPAKKVVSF